MQNKTNYKGRNERIWEKVYGQVEKNTKMGHTMNIKPENPTTIKMNQENKTKLQNRTLKNREHRYKAN